MEVKLYIVLIGTRGKRITPAYMISESTNRQKSIHRFICSSWKLYYHQYGKCVVTMALTEIHLVALKAAAEIQFEELCVVPKRQNLLDL